MKKYTPVITVVAIALAGFLLYRALDRYSFDQVVASVTAIPRTRLLAAGGFAAASYVCLTGFDALGVRYAGRPLAYGRVALASFTHRPVDRTQSGLRRIEQRCRALSFL
jgi:uncharacterized membrane protein YbhN (UPF0104 family)